MANRQTIVLADDDRELVQSLQIRCESLGLNVFVAHDALDALNLIHRANPAIVCLDVNMPSGSGLSVLRMLADDRNLCGTPVIILSGETGQELIRSCHTLCAYYVEKSTNTWDRLEPLLRELLRLDDHSEGSDGSLEPKVDTLSPVAKRGDAPWREAHTTIVSPPTDETEPASFREKRQDGHRRRETPDGKHLTEDIDERQ